MSNETKVNPAERSPEWREFVKQAVIEITGKQENGLAIISAEFAWSAAEVLADEGERRGYLGFCPRRQEPDPSLTFRFVPGDRVQAAKNIERPAHPDIPEGMWGTVQGGSGFHGEPPRYIVNFDNGRAVHCEEDEIEEGDTDQNLRTPKQDHGEPYKGARVQLRQDVMDKHYTIQAGTFGTVQDVHDDFIQVVFPLPPQGSPTGPSEGLFDVQRDQLELLP